MDDKSLIAKKKIVFIVFLLILASIAGIYIAYCTEFGPWGFSDTAAYFSAARNFAAGHSLSFSKPDGSFSPLNLHGPLFPVMLSVLVKLNIDLISSVRILDIVFWAIFIFSCGWLVNKITDKWIVSLCFALLCAFSYPLANLFSSLMSEPLAIIFGVPGFMLLILAVKENSLKFVIVSGILCGLAVVTRFAFASIPVAGVLTLLLFSKLTLRKRVVHITGYVVLSGLPILTWIVVQRMQNITTGGRSFTIDAGILLKAKEFAKLVFNTMKFWVPYRSNMIPGISAKIFMPALAMVLLAIVIVGLVIVYARFGKEFNSTGAFLLTAAYVFYVIFYFCILFFPFAFSSEPNDVNGRILAPLIPAIFGILLGSVIMAGSISKHMVFTNMLALIITLFFVVFNFELLRSFSEVSNKHPNGYTSPAWKGQPVFTEVMRLPIGTPLISNIPDITLFYTNLYPYCLTDEQPERGVCYSIHDIRSIRTVIEEQCGVLILFPSTTVQNYPDPLSDASIDLLVQRYSVLYKGGRGVMLYWPQCSSLK